jgi:uncharacterized protein (DUF302 family)
MTDGLITADSAHDFATTLGKLMAGVQARSLTIFAVVDHADGAEIAGLELAPTTLVIFGNAKGGTPLMQKNPRAGIDLPLKALVWQDAAGVHVSVNDPAWIAQRHGLEPGAGAGLAQVLEALVAQATR